MNLDEYFEHVNLSLRSKLYEARASFKHSGNKGDRAEIVFRDFLRRHIARIFDVGHGEVVDREMMNDKSGRSKKGPGQLDVIVFDSAHPKFSEPEDPGCYFIESVTAAAEVKSKLKLSDLDGIMDKAIKFKTLQAILGNGDMVMSNEEDGKRFVDHRAFFLFAFDSETSLNSFYKRMLIIQEERGVGLVNHIDAVFFMDKGALINLGSGNGIICSLKENGERQSGWIIDNRPVLISLISWLGEVMPIITHFSPVLRPYLMRSFSEVVQDKQDL